MPRKKRSPEQLQAIELASPEVFEAALRKVLKVRKADSDRQIESVKKRADSKSPPGLRTS
jgi:hypothetical protein